MFCFISAPISRADPQKQTEADNITAAWSDDNHVPSKDELKRAAQLALGLLLGGLFVYCEEYEHLVRGHLSSLQSVNTSWEVQHRTFDILET